MNLVSLLTSFDGRIGRKWWWIGLLIIIALAMVGGLIDFFRDPSAYTETEMKPPGIPILVWSLILFFPSMAITFQRLNDRDWPSWVGYAVGLLFLPWYIGPFFGRFWDFGQMASGSWDFSTLAGFEQLHFWVVIVVALLLFIDNGFIRGTKGPNQYGPDPVADGAAA